MLHFKSINISLIFVMKSNRAKKLMKVYLYYCLQGNKYEMSFTVLTVCIFSAIACWSLISMVLMLLIKCCRWEHCTAAPTSSSNNVSISARAAVVVGAVHNVNGSGSLTTNNCFKASYTRNLKLRFKLNLGKFL